MNSSNRKVGNIAEDYAVLFLSDNGYNIINRNYQKRCGEIDIIAQKLDYIHFIEVKYRKYANFGYPSEAVNLKKQEKIKKTALLYIQEQNIQDDVGISFDIIEILDKDIIFLENAFE